MQPRGKPENNDSMIVYKVLSKVRRELDNIFVLMDELEKKGLPKEAIVKMILNESEKPSKKDECSSKDK